MENKRKAQIEMMGLVVIVIIIAVAFLFLFYYLAGPGKENANLKQTYQKELLAYNSIGAVLQATTECRQMDIADLIEDCASVKSVDCFGKDSCTYAGEEIAYAFNAIFTQNNVFYYFFVMDSRQPPVRFLEIGQECAGSRTSATQPLPSRAGDLIIGIDICED